MTERQIIEDKYPETDLEEKVRDAVAHWQVQHDYGGVLWDGIESIHFSLADAVNTLAIESAGWYSYPSSLRSDMDGKDWRLVITDPSDYYHVVVNCHSILHDNVWTLGTTIYSTNEIDGEYALEHSIGDEDPWIRSMLWSMDLADKLQTSGYDYSKAMDWMRYRLSLLGEVWPVASRWIAIFKNSYRKMFDEDDDIPEQITIAINDWALPVDKIASYRHATDDRPYGVLTISPNAWNRGMKFVEWVVIHELIHAANGPDEKSHDERFKLLSDLAGIPEKYQD